MSTVVSRLRRSASCLRSPDEQLQRFLIKRGIASVRVLDHTNSDGFLEPIGSMYMHGFNISVGKSARNTRLRFTIAHELCHTFFYEYVPEVKFVPHAVDPGEERLCDFGAAELLMPATSVQKTAEGLTVCMQSLYSLAAGFSVSVLAMFLRLRSLRIWSCVFSEWHRQMNGNFVLANFYGGKRLPWEWEEPSILQEAWESRCAIIGNTVVGYDNGQGQRYYYPARFELRRFGNRLLSLWGPDIARPRRSSPLFPH